LRSDQKDLPRIRRVLDEDAADPKFIDIDFLRRWGAWEDICRINKVAINPHSDKDLTSLLSAQRNLLHPAMVILKLAGERVRETFALDLSPALLARIIASMSITLFRKLDQETIEELLRREATEIRKATALQILNALGSRQANAHLTRYLDPTKQKYYNVVFWLDLCNAWDRINYRKIAQRELQKIGV
jgi:hypothetical protein